MCSFHMLPASKKLRHYIYNKLTLNKCELHFVLDNWKVKSENQFTELETIIEINKIIKDKHYQSDIKQIYENTGYWC
jgi:sporadic carbohydrate cluster protein (TIGR04323 family)